MKMFDGICSVCGGPEVGRPKAVYSFGGAVHTNPETCKEYLEEKNTKKNKKEVVK